MEALNEKDVILRNMVRAVKIFERSRSFALLIPEVRTNLVYALSGATLIITASSEKANDIVKALEKERIQSSIIGEIVPKEEGKTIIRLDGSEEELRIPLQDPFWPAFFRGLEKP